MHQKLKCVIFKCLAVRNNKHLTDSSTIEQDIRLGIAYAAWHFLGGKQKDNNVPLSRPAGVPGSILGPGIISGLSLLFVL